LNSSTSNPIIPIMSAERHANLNKETEEKPIYPAVLFCGYSKSGTTIITKTFAHCTGQPWSNEARELWGIGAAIDRTRPLSDFHLQFRASGRWAEAQPNVKHSPILKFPEGMLIIDLFPPETSTVCVVRNPLDNVCAYLERKHEFSTLDFTTDELVARADDWNYHYLTTSQAKRPIKYIRYEDFVDEPVSMINEIAKFLDTPIINNAPDWINEQAQPYYRYLPEGHEIRGIGRYKLSIRSDEAKSQVLEACRPALGYLNTVGIQFGEVLK